MKVLLYNMISDTTYGKLIFDLNGEYFLRGIKTYGLGYILMMNKIKDTLLFILIKK